MVFIKIVYFGSDVFLNVFTYATQVGEVMALYTYHNDEDYFNEKNIVTLANKLNIPVHYEIPSMDEMQEWINRGADLFLSAEYNGILPIPSDESFRGINFHCSFLPQGRSYYPIECAMQKKLGYVGVTAHKLISALDKGDIIAQEKIPITQNDDSVDAYIYCASAALKITKKILSDLDGTFNNTVKQTKTLPYWHRPSVEAMTLRSDMTKNEASEIYRVFNKMTEVKLDGKKFFVDSFAAGNAPITENFIFIRENRVLFRIKDGHLRLDLCPCNG